MIPKVYPWLLTAFFSLMGVLSSGQDYLQHIKRNLPTYGTMFLGGAGRGAHDVLLHHYSSSVFPQEGPKRSWYDPEISWKNKYQNWPIDKSSAYFGAKTFLSWTTDAYHMTQAVHLTSMQISVVCYEQPPQDKFWWKILDIAIMKLSFTAGHHLTRDLLTK